MPKIKSHSGSKKRFKRTKRGKWLFKRAGQRHLLAGEKSKLGRQHRRPNTLPKAEAKVLDHFLPYA